VPVGDVPAHGGAEPASSVAIRESIRRTVERREAARLAAGRMLADEAQVGAAVRDQRERLAAADRDIDAAIAAADGAADAAAEEARRDAGGQSGGAGADAFAAAAAHPYRQTADALRGQKQVLAAATAQLDRIAETSGGRIAQSRTLMQANLAVLDTALREQLKLLLAVERAERARMIARARQLQRRQSEPPR
jgi:hypothetical protein